MSKDQYGIELPPADAPEDSPELKEWYRLHCEADRKAMAGMQAFLADVFREPCPVCEARKQARANRKVVDLSDLDRVLEEPSLQDGFKLARRFGNATRVHFKGRAVDAKVMTGAAMAALQSALREVPEGVQRREAFEALHDQLDWFEDFLAGLGRPVAGEG